MTTKAKKQEIEKIYPLTPTQKGMLYYSLLDQSSGAYVEQMSFDIIGSLSVDLLENSFDELIKRYDVFRTVFKYNKLEEPLQVVLKDRKGQVSFEDISSIDKNSIDDYIKEYLSKDRQKGFDVTRDILLRLSILKTGEDSYKIIWTFHHIIMDGWCIGIIVKEAMQVYCSLKKNAPVDLEPVYPYSDYINWLERQDKRSALSYWQKYIEGYEEQAVIPLDNKEAFKDQYKRNSRDFSIDKYTTDKLKVIAKDNDVTLNTIIQSIWGILLQKYNNTDDVIFGSVVSGRPSQINGIDKMVGLFINTIPVRIKCSNEMTFSKLINEAQQSAAKSKEFDYYALSDIQSASTLGNKLIDHIIVFENYPVDKEIDTMENDQDLGFKILNASVSEQTNYNLDIIIYPQEELKIGLSYNEAAYKSERIEKIGLQLKKIVSTIAQDQNVLLQDIDILIEGEREKILYQFNDTKASYPEDTTIHELFMEQVEKTPDDTAVLFGNERLSYRELNTRSNQLAMLLRKKGVNKDSIVGVVLDRSFEMSIGLMAILKAGGAYLPISPEYPYDRIRFIVEDSGANILLVHSKYKDNIQFGGEIVVVDDRKIYSGEGLELKNINSPKDLAYVIYTSGSTGNPKGVMIEHRSLINRLKWMQKKYPIAKGDVILQKTPYTFDVSVWEQFWWALEGAAVCFLTPGGEKDPKEILNAIEKYKISTMHFVPSMLNMFLEQLEEQKDIQSYKSLRQVFASGEALGLRQVEKFNKLLYKSNGTTLHNLYGPTEAAIDVSYFDCSCDKELECVPIGKPIDNISLYIVDKDLKLCSVGVPGELCIFGVGLARGYLNRLELTEQKFVPNPFVEGERMYRTGDVAKWLPNGDVEYLGRMDNQVKIRGLRIELGEIEERLLKIENVKEAVVDAREDKQGDKYIVAYYVSGEIKDPSILKEHLSRDLPEYMIPKFFIKLDNIPLSANGKANKKALPHPDKEAYAIEEYEACQSEIERKLAAVWGEILDMNNVGINTNFFNNGGDSIKSLRAISRTNKVLGTNLQLSDIYKYQTIKQMALHIDNNSDKEHKSISKYGIETINKLKNSILHDENQASKLPEDWEDLYPLSKIQQGMVFYSKIRPEEPIYHDQFLDIIKIESLDYSIYLKSIEIVMQTHPILRTTFDTENFVEPIQIVHKKIKPDVKMIDLSSLAISEQEKRIQSGLDQDLKDKFSFNGGILWRERIYKLGDDNYCIMFSFQHAVLDGWSVATYNTDLMEVYTSLANNSTYKTKKLKSSYKDYVAFNLSRQADEKTRDYWKKTLGHYTRNKLPFNISGNKINDVTGSRIMVADVDENLLSKLQTAAKRYGCTLKDICFGAHIYLLGIISNENDIITGVVTHDRPAIEDSEKVLGCFLNTVPIRVEVQSKINKLELLKTVKKCLAEVKPHELFLTDIANIINDKHRGGNPIFDTLFNFTDFHILDDTFESKIVKQSNLDLGVNRSEMTNTLFDLEVSSTLNELGILIKYIPNYFTEKDINTALKLYIRILEKYADERIEYFKCDELITDDEKNSMLYEFNNTSALYPKDKTIHYLFEEQVRRTPHNISLVMGESVITYKELNEKANQLARILIEKGVKSQDNVALITDRNFDMIIGMLAILKSGAAYVPVDSIYPKKRQYYIIENSKCSAVVVDKDYDIEFQNVIKIDYEMMKLKDSKNIEMLKDTKDLAYIIYTSGSTGVPKGVMIEHHSAVNLINWVNKQFSVDEKDTLLFITSMCFDLSVYDIFGILASGAKVVIAQKEQIQNPKLLMEILMKNKITFWDSVPTTMNYLMNSIQEEAKDYIQKDLRLVFMSGDWIPVNLPERIKKHFPNVDVISLGGATEGTVWSIYYPINEVSTNWTSIPYGKPIENNYFYILDDNMDIVPWGVAGELYIGGVGVARGYMNDHVKTLNSFVENKFLPNQNEMMYKTGDLGRMLPDGNIEFLGRKDHQVKIRGYRVELGEIENQLIKHDLVKETVVTDRTDKDGTKYLCAYVVAAQEIDSKILRDYLGEKLPGYMMPAYFVQMEKLPLNNNGKVDRKKLPEPKHMMKKLQEFEAPQSEIQQKLANIWKEVLELESVSVNDNFFELGGHSLKATTLVSNIHRNLKVELPLREVFNLQTLKDMARYIENAKKDIYSYIQPCDEAQYYPISSAQRRLYILNQMDTENTGYNIPISFALYGRVDKERIEEAFKKLIKRHQSLRTYFDMVDGRPVQKILEDAEFKLEYVKTDENSVKRLLDQFVRPFDLSKAPLLRAILLKISDSKYILAVDMHHIITDGISTAILINEFGVLYEGGELTELRIQYKDFSKWQNDMIIKGVIKKQEEYWLSRFSGDIPVLNLPTDYKRPSVQSFEGDIVNFDIDNGLYSKLNELSSREGATLYMVLLAAYNVVLSRYSGQEDIIVGTPIAGRGHADLNNVIGMFVNTLAMRSFPSMDKTFKDFLSEVKNDCIKAYENQDYQFEELVERLDVRRDMSRNPLFDVMFQIQNIEVGEVEFGELKFSPYELESGVSKFDMTLTADESDEGLSFNIEYSTKLFKRETIERIFKHFTNVLAKVVENEEVRLGEIELLCEEEKEKLLNDFNDTSANYPQDKTLHQMFEECVKKYADKTAVSFENESLTYRELNSKANKIARILREKGVGKDSIVALLLERSLETVIAIMGVLKAGGAYLPIDPSYPYQRINYTLKDSGSNVLITHKGIKGGIDFNGQIVDLDLEENQSIEFDNIENINDPSDLAYIIYTSGTTGDPKGAMIEHKNVVRLITNDKFQFNFGSSDVWTMFHSYCFDFSVWEMYGALLYGGELVIVPNLTAKDPKEYIELLKNHKVTVLNQTPTAFYNLINEEMKNEEKLYLRYVIFGGEELKPLMLKRWRKRYPDTKLINMYGITETTVHVTYKEILEEEIKNNISVIGKPIPTMTTYVMDSNMKLQPYKVAGELCVGGDGVGRGYLNRPELSADKFVQNPYKPSEELYRSGDLVRMLVNGDMEYLGRIDHQVKIRGHRIELGEIESKLLGYKDVDETVVIARDDTNKNKYICAYFVSDKEVEVQVLRDYLKGLLPDYMIPTYFVQIDKIPLTKNGKTDRKALPEPDGTISSNRVYEEPRNDIERKLVEIWESILGVKGIGINDDFFELGGHSLKAISLVSDIYEDLNVQVPLGKIFDFNILKELASYIESAKQDIYSHIHPVGKREHYPLSSAQRRQYILNQLELESINYNIPLAVILEGNLDIPRFEDTFKKLVKRHESLRTYFDYREGEPVQRICDDVDFDIEYIETSEESAKSIVEGFVTPFNLNKAPLIRAMLIKVSSSKHILMVDMHHIISDGVSMGILIEESAKLYEGTELLELKIQYKDFSNWQNEMIRSGKMGKQEKYWLNKFSGDIPVLNMPTDYKRPSLQSFEGSAVFFKIDNGLYKKLKDFASKKKSTMYMILLASFNVLISKYTGQDDIIVGTPVAGRSHSDLNKIIGMFVNTLAMRNNPSCEKTFKVFLNEVKNDAIKAFENQDYQFEELVEKLDVKRDMSRNPLFDIMFQMQNIETGKYEFKELDIIPYDLSTVISKFDMTLTADESDEGLNFSIEYSTKLFKRETIERISKHFTNVLAKVVENEEVKLGEIELLCEKEKEQLLNGFNDTSANYPQDKTLHQMFEECVKKYADKTAVSFENESLTYRELNSEANKIARILREKGVGKDSIVALLLERSLETVIAIMGVLKAGGAYLPIDPSYPSERINYTLKDSGSNVLITHKGIKDSIDFNGQIVDLDVEENQSIEFDNIENINTPNDLAYIIYTSGTTGNPKGAMIEHKNVVRLITNDKFQFDFGSSDVWTMFHSYCFDFSVWEMYGALLYGGELVIVPNLTAKDPKEYIELLKNHKVTVLNQTPTAFYNLINEEMKNEEKLYLRYVIFGGEELKPLMLKEWRKRYPNTKLINMYGITETTVHVTYKEISEEEIKKNISVIGKPIPTMTTYVMDSNMKLLPFGVAGELCVGGDGVGRGYLNRPELSADKFVQNPYKLSEKLYRSGDLVRMLVNGDMEYLGRIDHQVKIRGHRIELGEIESKLLGHKNIDETVVIARDDANKNKYICAYYVSDKEVEVQALRDYLKGLFPDYMIPTYFVQIDKIPLTKNGKTDRKALPEPDGTIISNKVYEEPRTDIERKLVEIWESILGVKGIGINDNFFELGGHSLKAWELVSKLYKEINVQVPLIKVFENTSLKELAEYIKTMDKSIYTSIPPLEYKEYYELSSAQKRVFAISQLDGIDSSYNIMDALIINGHVDIQKLEGVFYKLIERHEALRTSFHIVEGKSVQKVHEKVQFEIDRFKYEENIDTIVEELMKPFDLKKAPLFRVGIIEKNPEENILVYCMHHIISDGESIKILAKEFDDLYNKKQLPSLKIQYKDFAKWQNDLIKTEYYKTKEQYWLNKFSDSIPVLKMPTDYIRPEIQSFEGDRVSTSVETGLVQKLNMLSKETNSTMFMILLSSYYILLSKYSGQEDIVVGTGVAGRNHPDFENVMGMFVNSLALRIKVDGEMTITEFIDKVRKNTIEAFDNQDYQFEMLVDKLQVTRNKSRNPLFDVAFVLDNSDLSENIGDLQLEQQDFDLDISKLDITLYAKTGKEFLDLSFEYCTKLFSRNTMEVMIECYLDILEKIADKRDIKIKSIELLEDDKTEEIKKEIKEGIDYFEAFEDLDFE